MHIVLGSSPFNRLRQSGSGAKFSIVDSHNVVALQNREAISAPSVGFPLSCTV